MAFHQVDLRDHRLAGGGPSRLTTRRLVALIDHLGYDSPLWAEQFGDGFTLSQRLAMEAPRMISGGRVHPLHPSSPERAQFTRAARARDRAAHYQRLKARQEAERR